MIETLGLNKLDSNSIIGNEVSYFAIKTQSSDNIQSTDIASFNIDEETIIRVDNISDNSLKRKNLISQNLKFLYITLILLRHM